MIVVDAMGGDHAPREPVRGAVLGSRRTRRPVLVVGRAAEIERELAGLDVSGADVRVVDAPDVVAMDETNPASAVRTMPDSSISRAMSMVRRGEGEGLVTMGHTGAALAGATFRLGRLHGVRRPALAVQFPTTTGTCVLIDIGANTEVRPLHLAQFGAMGASYAERVLGIARPRVGLVSNGEERGKGTPAVKAAAPLLEASGLRFVGNIEGGDVAMGAADVAVFDGFTGNVMLKFAEAVPNVLTAVLRETLAGDILALPTGLLLRRALRRARARLDYRTTGGAVLLGVRGVVIVGHGRSDAEAMETAIVVAARAVENDLVGAIEAGIARVGDQDPEADA